MKKYYIAFLLLIFFSCNNQESDNVTSVIDDDTYDTSIAGEYRFEIFMYFSVLELFENGTYQYENHGCTGKGMSVGNWILKDSIFILNSFERPKEEKRVICDDLDIRISPTEDDSLMTMTVLNSENPFDKTYYFKDEKYLFLGNSIMSLPDSTIYQKIH